MVGQTLQANLDMVGNQHPFTESISLLGVEPQIN
jgi:hypothetical protein